MKIAKTKGMKFKEHWVNSVRYATVAALNVKFQDCPYNGRAMLFIDLSNEYWVRKQHNKLSYNTLTFGLLSVIWFICILHNLLN